LSPLCLRVSVVNNSVVPDFISISQPERESLHMLGLHLDPTHDEPQLYTLIAFGGEADRPLMEGDRIIFFTRPELAAQALDVGAPDMKRLGPVPTDPELICDVAHALYLVNSQELDEEAVIFSCLTVLDDLVRASRLNLPAEYMSVLSRLAEHMSGHSNLGEFLREHGIDRERIENAIIWCVGALTVKATVLN
jgi:hypothetical protein